VRGRVVVRGLLRVALDAARLPHIRR
jgi:hypothetical protein